MDSLGQTLESLTGDFHSFMAGRFLPQLKAMTRQAALAPIGLTEIMLTPRRTLLRAPACTHATPRPQRAHRRTIFRRSRSEPSPDNHTAHREATLPGTSVPGPCSLR